MRKRGSFADPSEPNFSGYYLKGTFKRRHEAGKRGLPPGFREGKSKSMSSYMNNPERFGYYSKYTRHSHTPGPEALRERLRGYRAGKAAGEAKKFGPMRQGMKRGMRRGTVKGRRQMIAPALGLAAATGLGGYAMGKVLGKRKAMREAAAKQQQTKTATMDKESLFLNAPHRQRVMLEEMKKRKEKKMKKKAAGPGCPDKPMGPARGPRDKTGPHNPLLKKKLEAMKKSEKKASIDDEFARDLNQMVGLETETERDWQRPDVRVEGQATDRIDEHFLGWMRERADDDVVKTASTSEARKILAKGKVKEVGEYLRKVRRRHLAAGAAAGGAAGLVGGVALGRATKKAPAGAPDTGVKAPGGQVKQAGVVENPENLDLMSRIRKAAENQFKSRDV